MKRMLFLVLPLALTLAFSGLAPAADKPAQANAQSDCPVMGGKIDKKVYADYKGKRIYFCCTGCVDEFKKDPEKFMKKMQSQGIDLEKTP